MFIGHASVINDVIYYNEKLWTIGNEGVIVWNAHKPQ